MLSSTRLKEIVSEARPYIEQQMDAADVIAGFRDVVAAEGGDWSALKALIKAQIKDERDDAGDGKHVRKILDKAEFSSGYAEMLGWSNMNEQNFSSGEVHDEPATEPQRPPAAQTDHALAVTPPPSAVESETVENSTPHPEAKASTGNGATARGDVEGPADSVTGDASRPAIGRSMAATSDEGRDSPERRAPHSRSMSISPLEPREAGGLKGFGFTVSFADAEETREQRTLRMRPYCQRPSAYGGVGKDHCFTCRSAMQVTPEPAA